MAARPKCKHCATAVVPDPTDPEDWIHDWSGDAQCRKMHNQKKLDSYAQPRADH